jgi:hypothetical protein
MSNKGGGSLRILPNEGEVNLNIGSVWNQLEVAEVITNYHLTWAKIKAEMKKSGYKPFIIRGRHKKGLRVMGKQVFLSGSKFLAVKIK